MSEVSQYGMSSLALLTCHVLDVMVIPDSEEDETKSQPEGLMWHGSTFIAISSVGNLLLNNSAMDVQELFKDSMLALERHMMFTDAYLDSNPQQKFSFLRKLLVNEAQAQAPKILDRLKQDTEYLKVLTESVSTLHN